ncbi:EamA/RhaT family transporter [Rhodococcus sp. D2-41]|uniref:EamA/RhaT family transporter n=1 Tax=Speluncibacter jeojiensis TaxID=2710754 RepID=A0A9X4M2Y7_9ACTN|nr:EamA/RhaT family transporter [Rhodococcus sp. D2-41]MDG3009347.1 EamA/RhaT family transporter [Rhodococcus sp. D2-41]MDG3017100.1 EamA/RhaT family transporter [Corynebacteriales bacterium D3-21]
MFVIGVFFASAAAIAYGVSTVLRALGARNAAIDERECQKQGTVTGHGGPSLTSTADTFRSSEFVWGTAFLVLGFIGGAIAARFLPLFLSQTIVSANLVVTALLGTATLGNRLFTREWVAIGLVIASLCALGVSSTHTAVDSDVRPFHWTLFAATCALSLIAWYAVYKLGRRGAILYGALAGVLYGVIVVGVRVLDGIRPFEPLKIIADPAAWTIALAGTVGFYVQTVALQVGHVNGVTAVLVVGETAAPGTIGVVFLGDHAKPGLSWLALVGFLGAVVGAVLVALYSAHEADHFDEQPPPTGGWSLRGRFGSRSGPRPHPDPARRGRDDPGEAGPAQPECPSC